MHNDDLFAMAMVARARAMSSPTHDIHSDSSSPPPYVMDTVGEQGHYMETESQLANSPRYWSPTSTTSDDTVLPSWAANPQSADDLDRKVATHRRKFSIPLFFVGFLLVGLAAVLTSMKTVNAAAEQVQILSANREEMDVKLKRAEKEMRLLKREILAMDAMFHQNDAYHHAVSSKTAESQRALGEMKRLQEYLHNEARHAETLKLQVQTASRQATLDKYGKGPYRVQMDLVFPDHKLGPSKFVMELASLDDMPHSVYIFLEMVSTGLLDGCSFILNALHVLKAAPLPYDGSSAADKARAFSQHNLESVAFREYSEKVPHKQYTIGFAADGSPSFYINTEDNSEIHMGDPCFGKIVEGLDAVRRLEASPTKNGIWFEKRIGIKSAKILN